jgi:hypothetical protein
MVASSADEPAQGRRIRPSERCAESVFALPCGSWPRMSPGCRGREDLVVVEVAEADRRRRHPDDGVRRIPDVRGRHLLARMARVSELVSTWLGRVRWELMRAGTSRPHAEPDPEPALV